MAPGLMTTSAPVPSHQLNGHSPSTPSNSPQLDRKLFPDGLKTSGQHAAVESLLFPYSEFPKYVDGPTMWRAEKYRDNPEKWTHPFTEYEVAELSAVADRFIESGIPLTGMARELFPLPILGRYLSSLKETILDGRGFVLFKNLPVTEWGLHKSAVVYMGLGTYFGYFVSQNHHGHVLGHVKDLREDPMQTHTVRIYRTNARQFFHTDGADLVGLLCIARSLEGGESDIVSTQDLFNTLQAEHPDVVETFLFYMENDPKPSIRRVFARFDPMNVVSLSRFNSGPNPQIPPLSEEQLYAIKTIEEVAKRLSLHMILEPGDIQLLANTHVFHARTAYKDWPVGSVDEHGKERIRRHLMRLWLATPESEGGWRTAFPDSKEKKRGGIQVDYNPPTCPLDAE